VENDFRGDVHFLAMFISSLQYNTSSNKIQTAARWYPEETEVQRAET
jgi:hypothetical protein